LNVGKKKMTTSHKKLVIRKKKPIFVCGIDVHKHEMTVALYSASNRNLEFNRALNFDTTNESLTKFWNYIKKYKPLGFVCEATGIYHHTLVNFLRNQQNQASWSYEVTIVNPADAAAIPGKPKNDKVDAIRLAKYYWHGLLKHGHHYQKTFDKLKSLFRYLNKLEKEKTQLKNRIKKELDREGFRPRQLNLNNEWILALLEDYCSFPGEFIQFIENLKKSPPKYYSLLIKHISNFEPYFNCFLSDTCKILTKQNLFEIKLKMARETLMNIEIEKTIADTTVLRHHAHNLSTIPGLSKISALWFLVEIGNISRFPNVRSFLSYAGVSPSIKSSAGKVYSAHINRQSNKYLRTLLYNAAVVVCNITKKKSGLKIYAERIKRRKAGRSTLIYCTVASKIARIAYSILKNNTEFMPDLGINAKNHNLDLNCTYSILEQKKIKRAKRYLKSVAEFNQLSALHVNIQRLILDMENLL
jgi:transposase